MGLKTLRHKLNKGLDIIPSKKNEKLGSEVPCIQMEICQHFLFSRSGSSIYRSIWAGAFLILLGTAHRSGLLTTFRNISQHFTTISTMTEIYFTDMFHCMTHMFHGIHGTQAVVIKLHGAQLENPEHHHSNSGCRDTLQIGSKYSNHIEQFQSKTTGPEVFTQRWSCHHPKTEGFNLLSRAYNTT